MTKSIVDTICASATGPGKAALSIVRVSGPNTNDVIKKICPKYDLSNFGDRRLYLGSFVDREQNLIDEGLLVTFKAPNSFTGEDSAEFHVHGNPIIVENMLHTIVSHETRMAEPGEFSRRALVNERMSVSDIESMDWILNGPSTEAIRIGLRNKIEGIGLKLDPIKEKLLNLLVLIEGQLDFTEEDVGLFDKEKAKEAINELINTLSLWISQFQMTKKLMSESRVVILGEPNTGKSSLFNTIIGMQKSIVYDEPGTTRDSVESRIDLSGLNFSITDTAGLRETHNMVEKMGINRSIEVAKTSDSIIWVSDRGSKPPKELNDQFGENKKIIYVKSKADLSSSCEDSGNRWILFSALTGLGKTEILRELVENDQNRSVESVLISNRQESLCDRAKISLQKALEQIIEGQNLEFVASSVKSAANSLDEITGKIAPSDVLKTIFSRFCIGK